MDLLNNILKELKINFSINNIEQYQILLNIIYNSIFLHQDEEIKVQIYDTLSFFIEQIELSQKDKLIDINNLYNLIIPYYLQDDFKDTIYSKPHCKRKIILS